MRSNSQQLYPPFLVRILSVWYRHYKVYTKSLISNGLPPFLEPLIFLVGIGLGMSRYIHEMAGISYLSFMATGLPMTSAMYTAAFECSYSTFIRLEFDKVYDGMLSSPLSVSDVLLGEVLWAGTKGLFFSFAVVLVMACFGFIPLPAGLLAPFVGFLTGVMFATLSLAITSFVSNINHFNFYFTGILSPMFFFSGVIFPIENLPAVLRYAAEAFPLTHAVRITRDLTFWDLKPTLLYSLLYIVLFTLFTGWIAWKRLGKRMIY
ncbi:MAG: ABC transporter permease [Chitinispirillales bacterium]|jgi:lipooligosaccharide transport system permease protein|nr:ABC transporter permease [Chitinispirillales bacterium]